MVALFAAWVGLGISRLGRRGFVFWRYVENDGEA
jgi:hypothetical protein